MKETMQRDVKSSISKAIQILWRFTLWASSVVMWLIKLVYSLIVKKDNKQDSIKKEEAPKQEDVKPKEDATEVPNAEEEEEEKEEAEDEENSGSVELVLGEVKQTLDVQTKEEHDEKKEKEDKKVKEEIISKYTNYIKETNEKNKFDQKTFEQRTNTINELILSEVKYRSFLEMIIYVYKESLKKVIPEDTCKLFFSNVELIMQLSKQYSDAFSKEYKKGIDKAMISNCFEDIAQPLKLYFPYLSSYNTILSEYSKLRATNKQAEKIICNIEEANPSQNFNSLMIMPVQRLPRYILLLKEILKATPKWHPDHDKLINVIDQITKVTKETDEKCNESENKKLFFDLVMSIPKSQYLITPSRTMVSCYKLNDNMELNLLNDAILITKFHPNKKKYQRSLKYTVLVKDILNVKRVKNVIVIQTKKRKFKVNVEKNGGDLLDKLKDLMK